jgi:hypothetical protein
MMSSDKDVVQGLTGWLNENKAAILNGVLITTFLASSIYYFIYYFKVFVR